MKKNKTLKNIFNVAMLCGSLTAVGVIAHGGTDRKGAETTLTNQGYKVISYEGKPGWLRQNSTAFYEDEFIVRTPQGRKEEVIVGRNLTGNSQIYYKAGK